MRERVYNVILTSKRKKSFYLICNFRKEIHRHLDSLLFSFVVFVNKHKQSVILNININLKI